MLQLQGGINIYEMASFNQNSLYPNIKYTSPRWVLTYIYYGGVQVSL